MIKVHIFKRKKTYWMYYRINGKRIRKSFDTPNKHDAERMAFKKQIELNSENFTPITQISTLADFFKNYLAYAKTIKRPKTIQNDVQIWNQFSEWLKHKRVDRVDHITTQIFEKYRIYLLEKELKKSSINVYQRHISSILTYAKKNGYIDFNPIQGIKQYKVSKRKVVFLNEEEIEKVLSHAQMHSKKAYIIFSLGIYAGLRRSEIANARWEWFDFDHKIISVEEYGSFVPKDHQMRHIPMNNKLMQILLPYKKKEGFVIESDYPEEKRINIIRYDFKNSFNTVTKNAGLDWVTPHILRHTFASHLAKAGISLYKIQMWLGHSDPKTTMIYAHLQAQDDDINKI